MIIIYNNYKNGYLREMPTFTKMVTKLCIWQIMVKNHKREACVFDAKMYKKNYQSHSCCLFSKKKNKKISRYDNFQIKICFFTLPSQTFCFKKMEKEDTKKSHYSYSNSR